MKSPPTFQSWKHVCRHSWYNQMQNNFPTEIRQGILVSCIIYSILSFKHRQYVGSEAENLFFFSVVQICFSTRLLVVCTRIFTLRLANWLTSFCSSHSKQKISISGRIKPSCSLSWMTSPSRAIFGDALCDLIRFYKI